MKKQLFTLSLVAALLPAFNANAEVYSEGFTLKWKTDMVEDFVGK